ncbi:MAG: helix-turn-helix domain-containing protein [Planctomycetaceae bacterium]|nr:helix-turn-helix domain-containing protein [Phycisphaerales bacterium]MCE2653478.1 helix-turn-helix domain-containing protein [Planctomycetaceae bacterium]
MAELPNTPGAPPLQMTVSERQTAKILGVSPRTVFSLRQRGLLPTVRLPNVSRVLIPVDAIAALVAASTQTKGGA